MTDKLLNIHDIFQSMEVTRTSESFCFFGDKRISWKKIQKLMDSGEKVQFKLSPNTNVNWSDVNSVVDYYESFKYWNTYISGYSSRFKIYSGVLDVKDGLVFYENEYYLPSPTSNVNKWNCKQSDLKDGRYNVTLLKQENDWYPRENSDRGNLILNLFILGSEIKSDISTLKPNTNELWASQYNDVGICFGYNHSTWDGLSFNLKSFDIIKLFRYYYVKQRWSNDVNVDVSDNEIYKMLNPIYSDIELILKDALSNRRFYIEIDESYGDINVSNMLKFDSSISDNIFSIINECILKSTN